MMTSYLAADVETNCVHAADSNLNHIVDVGYSFWRHCGQHIRPEAKLAGVSTPERHYTTLCGAGVVHLVLVTRRHICVGRLRITRYPH